MPGTELMCAYKVCEVINHFQQRLRLGLKVTRPWPVIHSCAPVWSEMVYFKWCESMTAVSGLVVVFVGRLLWCWQAYSLSSPAVSLWQRHHGRLVYSCWERCIQQCRCLCYHTLLTVSFLCINLQMPSWVDSTLCKVKRDFNFVICKNFSFRFSYFV